MQDYKFGGLKMIDIIEFKHALKSSWIRRILKQKTNWICLLKADMITKVNDLCVRGIDSILILSKKVSIIFWMCLIGGQKSRR